MSPSMQKLYRSSPQTTTYMKYYADGPVKCKTTAVDCQHQTWG